MAELKLRIVKGSTQNLEIECLTEDDQPENFTQADHATLTVKVNKSDTATILERSVEATNLVLQGNMWIATLTQEEADALVVGEYVGQLAVRFGDDENLWRFTEHFYVEVEQPTANKVDS